MNMNHNVRLIKFKDDNSSLEVEKVIQMLLPFIPDNDDILMIDTKIYSLSNKTIHCDSKNNYMGVSYYINNIK